MVVAVQDHWIELPQYENLSKRLTQTIEIPDFTGDALGPLREIVAHRTSDTDVRQRASRSAARRQRTRAPRGRIRPSRSQHPTRPPRPRCRCQARRRRDSGARAPHPRPHPPRRPSTGQLTCGRHSSTCATWRLVPRSLTATHVPRSVGIRPGGGDENSAWVGIGLRAEGCLRSVAFLGREGLCGAPVLFQSPTVRWYGPRDQRNIPTLDERLPP